MNEMRVSQDLLIRTVYRELERSLERLMDLHRQAASAKRVSRPSDDPMAASRIMGINANLRGAERSRLNGDFVLSWLRVSESAVDQMEQLLERAKEIAVSQSSSTASTQSRILHAREVEGIYDQIIHLANTKLAGRYVFGGTETQQPPVERDEDFNPVFNGNNEGMEIRVYGDERVEMNVTAVDMLQESGILENLRDLITSLRSDDQNGVAQQMDNISSGIEVLNATLARIGGRYSQVLNYQGVIDNNKVDLSESLSRWQDADMALVLSELSAQQTVYEAALQTTAIMLNKPTLLDVLG
jgi:flagellar hook-associated protein 3 FlgL